MDDVGNDWEKSPYEEGYDAYWVKGYDAESHYLNVSNIEEWRQGWEDAAAEDKRGQL